MNGFHYAVPYVPALSASCLLGLDSFLNKSDIDGRINGSTAKPYLMTTGLSTEILAKVWTLADWDAKGYLDENEFAVAMHLIQAVKSGGEGVLPEILPRTMIP